MMLAMRRTRWMVRGEVELDSPTLCWLDDTLASMWLKHFRISLSDCSWSGSVGLFGYETPLVISFLGRIDLFWFAARSESVAMSVLATGRECINTKVWFNKYMKMIWALDHVAWHQVPRLTQGQMYCHMVEQFRCLDSVCLQLRISHQD